MVASDESQQKVNLGCVLALSLQQIRKYPYIVPELFSVWPASLDVKPFHTKLSKLGDWISSFNWDSPNARLNSHDLTWSDMKKKKQIKCIWEPISKQQKNKMFIKFRIKTIQIINQRGLFCRKGVPGSSWLMKEVLDIDILITKNGDRKIMHPIWLTKRSVIKTRKRNQFGQFWWTSKKVIPIVKSSSWQWVKGSREAWNGRPIVLPTRFCSLSRVRIEFLKLYCEKYL